MELKEMSTEFLLYSYSKLLKQMDSMYGQKKDIEKEIASRNENLEQRYQKGLIKLERQEGE